MIISTKKMLKLLYVLSWLIFIGVCIEAGGFITNALSAMLLKPEYAARCWHEVDLSDLYKYDRGYFLAQSLIICIVAVLRACMFYMILKNVRPKKLNLSRPFNKDMGRFIKNLSYLSFLIGLFSSWGAQYAGWLTGKGVEMPDLQHMRIAGADVWLFMSVTLFVIAQMFKRGIELQTENELTV